MIEAVNSVVSNAPLIRIVADQVATSRSFAGDALAVESVARGPVAPYISPHISVDPVFDAAVLQLRDSDTGDVVEQFPSDKALLQRAHREQAEAEAEAVHRSAGNVSPVVGQSSAPADFSFTVVQEAAADVLPSPGVGVAQVAISALSVGAQAGQDAAAHQVSVTA